ncbi:hypothetical protein, partial [Rhodococcus sp. R1101]|uniref:hypothetical protein n=1 Tax=Rhodococcus sp. R1101 TaxID=1170698 RepID=UPI001E58776E
ESSRSDRPDASCMTANLSDQLFCFHPVFDPLDMRDGGAGTGSGVGDTSALFRSLLPWREYRQHPVAPP